MILVADFHREISEFGFDIRKGYAYYSAHYEPRFISSTS